MTAEPREPSRLPVRGAIATVGTVGALTLLLSFQGGPLASSGPATAANEEPATDELIAADGTTDTSTVTAAAAEPVSYTGDAFSTRWGDVQVEVTLEGADITEVVTLKMPAGDHHTVQISEYVDPILREEAIASDSAAGLSVISGATYTSEAYADSLQSALDQAGSVAGSGADAEAVEAVEADAAVEETAHAPASEATSDEIRTATGDVVSIRWGDVQVAVTVQGDDVIEVEALQMPSGDHHTDDYSAYVEPILREEAIASDSADVSVVSGATYTSEAYAQSLQSALDQLGL